MRVKIDVTEKDIRFGQVASNEGCPVYRAARRVLHDVYSVGCIRIQLGAYDYCPLPLKVQRWIGKLDDGGKKAVRPFSFTLSVPEQYVKGE